MTSFSFVVYLELALFSKFDEAQAALNREDAVITSNRLDDYGLVVCMNYPMRYVLVEYVLI